jgi:RNA polymerase sigma factor (sigma-70 family)
MASQGELLGSAGEREALTAAEAALARKAAAGDGAAFATLYDRYESRIYNFCSRLLGSPDDAADATQDAFLKVLQRLPKLEDRDLNFSAYLYTAARNASYDMIGKRKKATPVDEIPEYGGGQGARDPGDLDIDPERTAMLASAQEEISAANLRLPERQREVLALREIDDKSYDEIAEIMDMNRNSVAQLISRARIKLRDELRGTALASIALSSPECERALPLIAARADGQLKDGDDASWLDSHMAGCDTCKVSEEAMAEAGTSYRGWIPLVPILWLRKDTIAKAAELTGSDWSQVANSPRTDAGSSGAGAGQGGAGGAGGTGNGAAAGAAVGAAGPEAEAGRLKRTLRSRRRAGFALLGALALLLGVFVAIVVGDDGTPKASSETSQAAGSEVDAVVSTGTDGSVTTIKKVKKKAADGTTTEASVLTKTLPSGEVTTTTLPSIKKKAVKKKQTGSGGGGGRKGGGGGVVNLPTTSNPTTAATPPPATTNNPPPVTTTTTTTTTNNPCTSITACPGGGGGTTTTNAPPPRRCVPTRTTRCP